MPGDGPKSKSTRSNLSHGVNITRSLELWPLAAIHVFGSAFILRQWRTPAQVPRRRTHTQRLSLHFSQRSEPMKDATLVCRSAFALVCLCPILIFGACAASGPPQQQAQPSQVAQIVAASDPAPSVSLPSSTFAAPTDENSQALQNLWNSRVDSSNGDSSSDFTLGPGDVLR